MESETERNKRKQFEDRRSLTELLFEHNLFNSKKDEIDYSYLCLDTVDLWLSINKDYGSLLEKKGVTFSFVLRGRRILRAAQFLIFKGFLPEAEILYRCINETILVLAYILDDPTDERVNKYITFEQGRGWDFRFLSEQLIGKELYQVYKNLSDYTHPGNFGRIKLLHQGFLQNDSVPDYDKAGMMLVLFGNAAVGLCELSNRVFPNNETWDQKHNEIYQTAIFSKNYDEAIKLAQSNDSYREFFRKHSNYDLESEEGLG